MRPPLALVVIEDPELRREVDAAVAEARGRSVHAGDEAALLRALDRQSVSMVFAAAGTSGLTLERVLLAAHRRRPEAPVIALGAAGSEPIRAVEHEVFDILPTPLDRAQLDLMVRRAALQHELLAEIARLRGLCGTPDPLDPLVGRSESMAVLRERIGAAAARGRAVLLTGETGTGRGLAARTIHAISSRRVGPFVRLDCARADDAATEDGAKDWTDEAFERARGGTIFLSEADRLAPDRQRQLVVAIRSASGSDAARRVASSERELDAMARDGAFDGELSALLAEEVLRVPPLRDRERDVLLIARRHVETVCALNGLPPARLEPAAVTLLESYRWPGNVAELRDAIERALTVASDGVIRPEHLRDTVRGMSEALNGGDAPGSPRRFRDAKRRVVDSFERSYLEELLGWHRGNVTAAAEQAGMLRSALQRLLRKHDLRSSEFRERGRRGASWRASS